MSVFKKSVFVQGGVLLFLGIVYLFLAWPGLHGPFVLDDWSNLSQLEEVNSWRDIWTYTFFGTSSSLGRPISLFSFALQAEHWVENTFPFKLANVLIHLFNGILLYGCASLCASFLGIKGNKRILFAGLSSFLWIILALNTTTIFYVVQRMTLLAGTFTLLGILGFLYGVSFEEKRGNKVGFVIASISMGAGYLFGILSKENAIMLGLFVGVTYFSVVRPQIKLSRNLWDYWALIFALFPLLMLFLYIVWDWRFLRGYGRRDFDLTERIMTEWRILWDYFFKIVAPSAERINIFNDDFSISRGVFSPISTFISGVAWLAVLIMSWRFRRTVPFLLFFAIWFLGGHALESSVIALELYFEHRNYLPSVGVVIALVWFVFSVWDRIDILDGKRKNRIFGIPLILLISSYCFLCSLVFYLEVKTWEDKESFHMSALNDRPKSFRANQAAAAYLAGVGDIRQATYLFYALDEHWPGYPGTYAYLIYLQCVDGNVVLPSREKMKERFLKGRVDGGQAGKMFVKIHEIKQQGGCQKLSWEDYRYWLSMLMENENIPKYGSKQNLLKMMVLSYVTEGDFKTAVSVLDPLPFSELRISTIRMKMELMMMLGRNDEALSLIQKVKKRFGNHIQVWGSQGHFFEDAEKELVDKKSKIKRLFDIKDQSVEPIAPSS